LQLEPADSQVVDRRSKPRAAGDRSALIIYEGSHCGCGNDLWEQDWARKKREMSCEQRQVKVVVVVVTFFCGLLTAT
jgi:hypothetical protein